MYAGKSHDFNGCVSSNAGMSSGETGDPTLVEIDEKLVLDEALSQMERHVRISDLVWCKDMGQPWWPGKVIGDSIMLTDSDESFESDIYLVVCFGDRSTAWHRVSCVKPFWENFPRLVKRSDIGSFRRAVDCALEEVSRRIKYTLTCRCLPKQIHVDVGRPFWGVSCEDKREAVLRTTSFVPRELVNYLQASSVAASGCDNRLVLEVTIAQLSAFFCWRAHSQELPVYSSLFAAIYGDSDNNFSENSVQKDNDIMDFYRPDKGTGSFPSSQNTSSMGGYAAYINVTMNVSLSPPDNDEKGKFPAETDHSGDISTPTIPLEKLGECVGESEEKNYATSLHMIFTDWNSVPSEADLHETFGRFGQLIELETKLYPKSLAARIVFQERSAAEAAFGIVMETLPSVVSFKLKLLHLKQEKSSRGRKRQRDPRFKRWLAACVTSLNLFVFRTIRTAFLARTFIFLTISPSLGFPLQDYQLLFLSLMTLTRTRNLHRRGALILKRALRRSPARLLEIAPLLSISRVMIPILSPPYEGTSIPKASFFAGRKRGKTNVQGCPEMDSREYFHFGERTLDSDDVMGQDDVEFSGTGRHVRISDLVWCKVMGQPWRPGKVIGNSIVLRNGDECLGNDSYLVVCFGNDSFEWYDAQNVKAFWENFPQMAKRRNTASFREAVSCALEEVSRRVKYTLTCKCMKEWIYRDVGGPLWAVDAGSNEESSDDDVTEEVILSTASFVPRELVDYIKESSFSSSDGDNKLVLEVAKAQLFALFFWRNRSRKLPVYASLFAELAEDKSPGDNRKKYDHMLDFAGKYKTPNSLSSSKDASVNPDNVDFIFSSRTTDKGKGERVNEPNNSLARGTKGLLLKESGDGAGSHIGSTEIDLMKETQSSNTSVPNLKNHAFSGSPTTAAEKLDDHPHQA